MRLCKVSYKASFEARRGDKRLDSRPSSSSGPSSLPSTPSPASGRSPPSHRAESWGYAPWQRKLPRPYLTANAENPCGVVPATNREHLPKKEPRVHAMWDWPGVKYRMTRRDSLDGFRGHAYVVL